MTPEEIAAAPGGGGRVKFEPYPPRPKWRVRGPSKYFPQRQFIRDFPVKRNGGADRISIYEYQSVGLGGGRKGKIEVWGPFCDYPCSTYPTLEEAFDHCEAWLRVNEYTPRPRLPNGSGQPSAAILAAITAALSSALVGGNFEGLSRDDFERAAIWVSIQRKKAKK